MLTKDAADRAGAVLENAERAYLSSGFERVTTHAAQTKYEFVVGYLRSALACALSGDDLSTEQEAHDAAKGGE